MGVKMYKFGCHFCMLRVETCPIVSSALLLECINFVDMTQV